MKVELKREAPISIYPPIVLYNTKDVGGIWDDDGGSGDKGRLSNIYVHIPFCPQRCDFCYFTSFSAKDSVVRGYVEALEKEMELLSGKQLLKERRFHTVYFGGGTPTYLKPEYLESIIRKLASCFAVESGSEFCVEVRPGNEATEEKLKLLKDMGVNRISMGAQSFVQDVLDQNGRRHRIEDFFKIYDRLRKVGFKNINIDIMSGMVGDNESTWQRTIETVLGLEPENITVYKMHIYKHSELYRKMEELNRTDALVSDSREISMIRHFYKEMHKAGYRKSSGTYTFTRSKEHDHAYRLSRTGGGELLGIGLSSNSFVNRSVYQNANKLEEYLAMVNDGILPVKRAYKLTKEEEIKRALIFGLKTSSIDRVDFIQKYGIDPMEVAGEGLGRMLEDGLAEMDEKEIRLTEEAYIFADDIARKYILSPKERAMEKVLVMHKNVSLKLN